jgi:hypothetical protein
MTAPATQQEAIQQFIDLANDMKNAGLSKELVSTALMRACAVYSTYVVTGNEGALRASGIEKIQQLFGQELETIQKAKVGAANGPVE